VVKIRVCLVYSIRHINNLLLEIKIKNQVNLRCTVKLFMHKLFVHKLFMQVYQCNFNQERFEVIWLPPLAFTMAMR
jgi:hypothetical protein